MDVHPTIYLAFRARSLVPLWQHRPRTVSIAIVIHVRGSDFSAQKCRSQSPSLPLSRILPVHKSIPRRCCAPSKNAERTISKNFRCQLLVSWLPSYPHSATRRQLILPLSLFSQPRGAILNCAAYPQILHFHSGLKRLKRRAFLKVSTTSVSIYTTGSTYAQMPQTSCGSPQLWRRCHSLMMNFIVS